MSTVPLNSLLSTPAEPARSPADRVRREHLFILQICLIAVAMSFLLVVQPDGQHVAFRFAPEMALPEACPVHALVHVNCPGCGLTRSFVSLAHGQWRASIAFHPIGWVLAMAAAAQIPYRLACLKWGRCPGLPRAMERWVPYTLVFLMAANWLIRLVSGHVV